MDWNRYSNPSGGVRRYIGDAVISIAYQDDDSYAGSIKVALPGEYNYVWAFDALHPPAAGFNFAYDSAQAYDRMAASAVSFGSYYTTRNRGDDTPDWAPDADTADAIENAVSWAQDDRGRYEVRRTPKGPGRMVG